MPTSSPARVLSATPMALRLLRACVLGDASAVRELLDQSAPVVPPALFAAVQGGHAEVVELLAANPNVDVNRCLANGCSPLFRAASLGHTDCAARLLDANAAVDAPSNGSSPLLVAAAQGHAAVRPTGPSLALTRTRARAHAHSRHPPTLHSRAPTLRGQAVELLLAHGAAPDGPTPEGTTPLIAACSPGSKSPPPLPASGAIARLLLRAGARVCLQDGAMTKSGWAVFGLAHRSDDDELMTLLEESCAEQRGAGQEEEVVADGDAGGRSSSSAWRGCDRCCEGVPTAAAAPLPPSAEFLSAGVPTAAAIACATAARSRRCRATCSATSPSSS